MVTLSSHRHALDVPVWFGLNQPRPGVHCPLGAGPGARTPLVWCCSGLSKTLQDFDLYKKMASSLLLALLGLGG